jgi:AraC-like DNA-binding protein
LADYIYNLSHDFADTLAKKTYNDVEFFNVLESMIRLHYRDENFNVDELSRMCRICKSHLREQIRHHYGFPPHFLIENIRLECALYLLSLDIKIEDLAGAVGFSTVQTFRRAFKRRLNISPSEFKKLAGENRENCLKTIELCKNMLWKYNNSSFLPGDFAS